MQEETVISGSAPECSRDCFRGNVTSDESQSKTEVDWIPSVKGSRRYSNGWHPEVDGVRGELPRADGGRTIRIVPSFDEMEPSVDGEIPISGVHTEEERGGVRCERDGSDFSTEDPSITKPWKRRMCAGVGSMICLVLELNGHAASFRYANSANRIYVENGGSASLTEIKAALPNAPLELVDGANGIWLLKANLFVTDGCTLLLHGNAAGGEANQLRLMSNEDSSVSNGTVSVEADWGTLDLRSIQVTSWNVLQSRPDNDYQGYGRAF